MNLQWIILPALLLLLFAVKVHGKRNFGIYLESCSCKFNSTYVDIKICRIDKSVDPPVGYFDMKFQRDVIDIRYSFDVILRKKNNELYTLFSSKDNDACALLEGKTSKTILNIFREVLMKFSNLPKKCPIEKDFYYVLDGASPDPDLFPPYVPEADFTVLVNFTTMKEQFFAFKIFGAVRQKPKKWWG